MTAVHEKFIRLPKDFHFAIDHRDSGRSDLIVFVHGFGSAKEHFRHAFSDPSLEGYDLLAIDLVGFGKSRGPEDFEYSMKDQAAMMLTVLDRLKIGPFHLCAHSMGGLIAIEMAGLRPELVLSLVDMEGNLTEEDCFLSGRIASHTAEEFASGGRQKLEEAFAKDGETDPAMAEYLESFRLASTRALYRSAVHTVADSSPTDEPYPTLVERLASVRNACYIYGEKNRGVYRGEKLLAEAGIPVFYIEDAGHSMATENPRSLYKVIRSFIDGLRSTS